MNLLHDEAYEASDERHQARLFRAVKAIYDAASSPDEWPAALSAVAEVFSGVGGVLLFQRDDGTVTAMTSPSLAAAQQAYADGWWRDDICFVRIAERSYRLGVDAVTDKELVSESEANSHPFFTRFLADHGLGRLAAASVSPTREVVVILSVHRPFSQPHLNERELIELTRLARHVENALRLGIRLITAEAAMSEIGDVLARSGAAIFLLDRLGRPVFINQKGRLLLDDIFVLRGGQLSVRREAEREAFGDALEQALNNLTASGATPRAILLHGAAEAEYVAAYIQPAAMTPREGAAAFSDVRASIVALSSKVSDIPDASLVRDLLGVTLSEGRLAALIANGFSPRTAADCLGVSEETARSALKRIFAKTGVKRQSELAALLARLVLR